MTDTFRVGNSQAEWSVPCQAPFGRSFPTNSQAWLTNMLFCSENCTARYGGHRQTPRLNIYKRRPAMRPLHDAILWDHHPDHEPLLQGDGSLWGGMLNSGQNSSEKWASQHPFQGRPPIGIPLKKSPPLPGFSFFPYKKECSASAVWKDPSPPLY